MDVSPELAALRRPATVAEIGGFRPPEDPWTSWIGRVAFGAPPAEGFEPLLQLVTAELPVVPDAFGGAALVTVSVSPERPPEGTEGVSVRTYARREDAPPLPGPVDATAWRAFPLRFGDAFLDWPSRDEVPPGLLDLWRAEVDHDEERRARDGLKVGGWPTTLQAETFLGIPGGRDDVDFVLQVDDHEAKAQFGYVAGDVTYVGRRRSDGVWVADWQST